MIKSSVLRVAPGAEGISIWSSEIFGGTEPSRVREFLARTFAVQEVEGVELRRATSFGRIRYGSVANPAQIWQKLSRALRFLDESSSLQGQGDEAGLGLNDGRLRRIDADLLYLDGPGTVPVRVSRIGSSLSTWHVRHQSENTLRLWHPVLRNRRDLVFRLEEALAAIFGVEDFRASVLSAGVSIRFDKNALTAERLARELEKAWPRLLDGQERPPSQKRFFAAGGLLGLAFTGQYLVPALRPIAVAGVAVYSFPSVVKAAKELAQGEVGLPALYATGLAFMLVNGLPFSSTVMAVLTQLWPQLAHRKFVRSQRRLFAGQRRRPTWARIPQDDGSDVEVSVDDLRKGDRIVVRHGEIVAVDGIVEAGSAVVVDAAPFSLDYADQLEDKALGDVVAAGAFVRDGSLTIRVDRTGSQTAASYVDSLLPITGITNLPSSREAERIANRNARPALAVSALTLLATRTLRPSQALIRPDYATAPRLSAQLSVLHGLAHGLQNGVLFRNPAAFDRLSSVEVYVFDESAGLERRRVEVTSVQTVVGVSAELVIGYVVAAYRKSRSERGRALADFASKRKTVHAKAEALAHYVGVTRYRDSAGRAIELATSQYLAAAQIEVPAQFKTAPAPHTRRTLRTKARGRRVEAATVVAADEKRSLRPLWVLRDGAVIGVVAFERSGDFVGAQVVAGLKARHKSARTVYVSQSGDAEAKALARRLGIDFAYGGLSREAKAGFIRDIGRKTMWIGDGSNPASKEAITVSTVSVSVAPLCHPQQDTADILLPEHGLDGLLDALKVGRAHKQRLADDYRTVYAANLLGVAGAFFARFSSLQAGLLSNVGTGLIYSRHARRLNRLASTVEAERARLKRSVPR